MACMKKIVVERNQYLAVLSQLTPSSVALVLSCGLKLDDIEQMELYPSEQRRVGEPTGLLKVKAGNGFYNLGVRAHLIEW